MATSTAAAEQRKKARKQMKKLAETAWVGDVLSPIDVVWNAMAGHHPRPAPADKK